MPATTITCPNCSAEGRLSLVQPDFEGAYACWKCHSRFSIKIQQGCFVSSRPLSPEEMKQVEQAQAVRNRFPPPNTR